MFLSGVIFTLVDAIAAIMSLYPVGHSDKHLSAAAAYFRYTFSSNFRNFNTLLFRQKCLANHTMPWRMDHAGGCRRTAYREFSTSVRRMWHPWQGNQRHRTVPISLLFISRLSTSNGGCSMEVRSVGSEILAQNIEPSSRINDEFQRRGTTHLLCIIRLVSN